jgi:hypothetical protein
MKGVTAKHSGSILPNGLLSANDDNNDNGNNNNNTNAIAIGDR